MSRIEEINVLQSSYINIKRSVFSLITTNKSKLGGICVGEIKIVEYDHSFAAGVADMWNRSTGNWGGNNVVRTEESVRSEHDNSVNLSVFLALDGQEVVGYCNFSKYANDEGALFIPLLNVRPDYHGMKVGKALVSRAVERTIELGWPRLDLFTWPGNTKAVPLYKKCGFFWEKRDDSTHLMNFIPYVVQTEAISEFFEDVHWYDDSIRVIEVKPDGVEENGFVYFEYIWEKGDKKLRVEFEKAARGIRLIENQDYIITANIQEHELVFGRNYAVSYDVLNKSGKPLHIDIKGLDNKNIQFNFEASVDVVDRSTLEGSFYVGEIYEDQNTWRTHPAVVAEVWINGKKALFKTGIMPRFPAKIALVKPQLESYLGADASCFIEVENNFKEGILLEFQLPEVENLRFDRTKFAVRLEARGRCNIPLIYNLKAFCDYKVNIPVSATLNSGEIVTFNKRFSHLFNGQHGMFAGENEGSWYISNGTYRVYLSKQDNKLNIWSGVMEEFGTRFDPPKIGKPYSAEFFTKRADRVDSYIEGDAVVQRACYTSADFPGIELASVTRLYQNGLVEHHYELCNNSGNLIKDEIFLGENVFHNMFRAVIPFEDKFIELKDTHETNMDFWESDKVSENWIFSKGDKVSRGICWHKGYQMKLSRHVMFFEHNLGRLAPGESVKTEPIYIAYGTYGNWQDFRAFALKEHQSGVEHAVDSLEFIVNDRNPFVKEKYKIELKEYKNAFFDGTVRINSKEEAFELVCRRFSLEEGSTNEEFEIKTNKNFQISTLTMDVDFDPYAFEKKALVFNMGKSSINTGVIMEEGIEVFSADNGVVSIKAAPDFSHSVYSMKYMGLEWLDTSFPNPGPRSWFNPWVGGIGCKPWAMTHVSILKESLKSEFVNVRDNLSNEWAGIKTSVVVQENTSFKGLVYNQYFLLLPQVPVMCFTVEVLQNTGKFFNNTGFGTECFLKPDEDIKNSWFISRSRDGEEKRYKSGRVGYNIRSDSSLLYGSENRKDKLQIFADTEATTLLSFCNKNDTAAFITSKVTAQDGKRVFTQPIFFIFTEKYIDDSLLKDLKNIYFG